MATYDKNEIIKASDKNFDNLRKKIKEDVYEKRIKGLGNDNLTSFNKYNNVKTTITETQNNIINQDPNAKRTINAMVGLKIDNITANNKNKIPTTEATIGTVIPSLTDLWTVVNDWASRGESNHGCNAACSGFCSGHCGGTESGYTSSNGTW